MQALTRPATTPSAGLVDASMRLLASRLRGMGYDEGRVREVLEGDRATFEGMSAAELASRYLCELEPWEFTGPH